MLGEGIQDPLRVGPVLSQRDHALVALKLLVDALRPGVGGTGGGFGAGAFAS